LINSFALGTIDFWKTSPVPSSAAAGNAHAPITTAAVAAVNLRNMHPSMQATPMFADNNSY
jgi:hypothetical protein